MMLEDYQNTINQIEHEMTRYAIAMNFDWNNQNQCYSLAKEFVDFRAKKIQIHDLNKIKFFGLADLMISSMTKSAIENHILIHGGTLWKNFAREVYLLLES